MTAAASASSASSIFLSRAFNRLDADGNGKVTKAEFVETRPEGIGADQSAAVFDQLDRAKTGALSESDLGAAFQTLASTTLAGVLSQQEKDSAAKIGAQAGGRRPDPNALFDELDTDADGVLTQSEFVAGRPRGLSEAQATSLFRDIAGGKDGVSQSQLADGLKSAGLPPGLEDLDLAGIEDLDDDTLQSLIDELLSQISTYLGRSAETLGKSQPQLSLAV